MPDPRGDRSSLDEARNPEQRGAVRVTREVGEPGRSAHVSTLRFSARGVARATPHVSLENDEMPVIVSGDTPPVAVVAETPTRTSWLARALRRLHRGASE